jgi:hypothetical protein
MTTPAISSNHHFSSENTMKTARKKHQAKKFHVWVIDQTDIWIDIRGTEHSLNDMPESYLEAVLQFLQHNASRFCLLHWDGFFEELPLEPDEDFHETAQEWINHSPLMQAITYHLKIRATS